MDINFAEWLKAELDEKHMTQSELAEKIGVYPSQVSRIISGERNPTNEILIKIGDALRVPRAKIFRAAGLLPPGPDDEIRFEDWKFLLDQMSPEDQEEMRQIAEMKIERRKKDESLKSLKTKRAGG